MHLNFIFTKCSYLQAKLHGDTNLNFSNLAGKL